MSEETEVGTVVKAILDELERQHATGHDGPYTYNQTENTVGVDGVVNLDALANAVISALATYHGST